MLYFNTIVRFGHDGPRQRVEDDRRRRRSDDVPVLKVATMTVSPEQNTQGTQSGAGARRRLSDRLMLQAQVSAVDQLSRTMRRIRLDTGGLSGLEWTAGQQIRVQVGSSPGAVD